MSCSAKATARPPTPNAVRIGAIDIPKLCNNINPPIIKMRIFVKFTKMEVEGKIPLLLIEYIFINATENLIENRVIRIMAMILRAFGRKSFRDSLIGV